MISIWTRLSFCQVQLKVNSGASVNFLPNDKILHTTQLKALAEDKLTFGMMMIFLLVRVENAVGKGENAGYQHFLFFPQCFPNPSSFGSLKVRTVWLSVNSVLRN